MTSTITPGFAQQDLEGRSVRDVVAYTPEQVNDAWCRKILRKILQSLALQYTMQMPHRAITIDTIVFHANGEPLLISDNIDAAPAPDAHQADDLTALAGVIHYAVTQELTPAGPLAGRVSGYSAALIATVDACMDPDPARRPRSIGEARDLLDIAAPVEPAAIVAAPDVFAPPERDAAIVAGAGGAGMAAAGVPGLPPSISATAASAPAFTDVPADPAIDTHRAVASRSRPWFIAAGGGAIALAVVVVAFTAWRDGGPHKQAVPTSPQAGKGGTAGGESINATSDGAGSAASGGSSGGRTQSGGGVDRPGAPGAGDSAVSAAPPAGSARAAEVAQANRKAVAQARASAPPRAVAGKASYQLQITPWGNVYVDGVNRGTSPPLKRLALTPGPHTVRITNPKYRDSILEFESAQTTSNGKIIVEFDREAQ